MDDGFSAIELLVVIAITATLLATAAVNLRRLDNPLLNGSAQLMAFVKQARAKAVSTTSAYIIEPAGAARVIARYGSSCADGTLEDDSQLILDLPSGVSLADTSWSICFNSRGLSDADINLDLVNLEGRHQILELFLGGAVRLQ
jgi:prepilin-type N-terminal cleavage/methylation domain-containing protein